MVTIYAPSWNRCRHTLVGADAAAHVLREHGVEVEVIERDRSNFCTYDHCGEGELMEELGLVTPYQ